ncbi:hypothetical protein [Nonomuraea sp. NPDC050643]|uniref:hypothetical protein n=1 Tax=Nonomuraea sp. NPDC050643 TaxID=3155660 RepID=UPI003401C336
MHHRSPQIDYADAFTREAWLDGTAQADWWIVPFAGGPGRCPGAELGLQVTASALARCCARTTSARSARDSYR